MSQWRGFNIHVIKTKRIECTKLNLPDVFAKPQSSSRGSHPRASLDSTLDSSPSSPDFSLGYERDNSSHSSIAGSLPAIESEDSLSPLKTPEVDDVFECSFATASGDSGRNRNVITRCLSLPVCLNCERGVEKESSVCSSRLSREALDFERCPSDAESRLLRAREEREAREASEGLWTGFPRKHEFEECRSSENIGMNRSRTSHAASMNRNNSLVLIADCNNNNSSSCGYKPGAASSNLTRVKSSFELRRDWEQKILDLTSGCAFGAQRGESSEELSRSRSVTLTENLHSAVSAQTAKDRDSEGRTKSESKQKMPKLQSVVWDYIKRRSTKRKSKRASQANGNSNPKETKKNNGKNKQTTSSEKQGLGNGPLNNNIESGNQVYSPSPKAFKISRNKSWSYSASSKAAEGPCCLTRWKSAPSLKYCETTQSFTQEKVSPSEKVFPKLRVRELEDDPEILKLLLTTSPEERPMEERLKTLRLSREWLLKELQGMREEDRRLARQFINLRSAIVEIRQAREKEESDYDSEGEAHKTRFIDSQKLVEKKKGIARERTLQMHVTPTRNILSY